MSEPQISLDHFLCFGLYAANHSFHRAYRPFLEAMGLTYPQYVVMIALWSAADAGEDDLTVGVLADRVCLETSTLTPLLKRIEKAGLITRRRDVKDERLVRIALTETGTALKAQGMATPVELMHRAGLTHEYVSQLNLVVRDLKARLDAAAADERPDGEAQTATPSR